MGHSLKQLGDDHPKTKKQFLADMRAFVNKYYQNSLSDYWNLEFQDQIIHEARVRDFVFKNKLTEVEYDGQIYKFDKNSFKINYDFAKRDRPCPVCEKQDCGEKYQSAQSYLRYRVHKELKASGLPKNYINDNEMMLLKNWTFIASDNKMSWWFW